MQKWEKRRVKLHVCNQRQWHHSYSWQKRQNSNASLFEKQKSFVSVWNGFYNCVFPFDGRLNAVDGKVWRFSVWKLHSVLTEFCARKIIQTDQLHCKFTRNGTQFGDWERAACSKRELFPNTTLPYFRVNQDGNLSCVMSKQGKQDVNASEFAVCFYFPLCFRSWSSRSPFCSSTCRMRIRKESKSNFSNFTAFAFLDLNHKQIGFLHLQQKQIWNDGRRLFCVTQHCWLSSPWWMLL